MDWYLDSYRYLCLVYRINGKYQVRTGWYVFRRGTINTIRYVLNAGRRDGDFFPSCRVAIFLKGQEPTGSHRPLCLFSCGGTKGTPLLWIKKDCPIAFFFCESRDQQYLPFEIKFATSFRPEVRILCNDY